MNSDILGGRLHKIFDGRKELDAILIVNSSTSRTDANFLYLTGFKSGLFEGSYVVAERGKITVVTTKLECETAKAQTVDGMEVVCVGGPDELYKALAPYVTGKSVGIDARVVSYQRYGMITEKLKPKKLVDVSDAFAEARMIKNNDEIHAMRRASSLTKMAMLHVQKAFKEGMAEKDLATEFDHISAKLGSEGPSFKTIVCFGKNASEPHHFPDSTKLRNGDFILIDAGAIVDNYCSDITRTFIFGQRDDAKHDFKTMEEMHRIVKAAQVKAIRAIKPGVRARSIHMIAQNYIDTEAGGKYKGRLIHSLGHSIGLEVHDPPYPFLSPSSKVILKPGMVTSVEPGIYIPGFGGVRIEDDVLVTRDGAIVL